VRLLLNPARPDKETVVARHEGERAVQLRAGFTREVWGSPGVRAEIPAVGRDFLRGQRMIVVGASDARRAPWATVLTGPAGFVVADGARNVLIYAQPVPGDPLAAALAFEAEVGMLAIEPQTRRRMRINGRSGPTGAGQVVHTEQVYSNCPKYVQIRQLAPAGAVRAGRPRSTEALTGEQMTWIAGADTCFVATYAAGHGADVSHRGGNLGFIDVVDERRLVWPDYVGNSMYMTLGNLALEPACGLLFVDWMRGHTLQLTGRAKVGWDPRRAAGVPGATPDRVHRRPRRPDRPREPTALDLRRVLPAQPTDNTTKDLGT
jgi:predicted pyridoxine 5'-phosphate oxidase superfamily flavin-nucleotide-binding protein